MSPALDLGLTVLVWAMVACVVYFALLVVAVTAVKIRTALIELREARDAGKQLKAVKAALRAKRPDLYGDKP